MRKWNRSGHPDVEALSASEFQEVVEYCTEILETKDIPDDGLLRLVDSFLRCE